MRAAGATNKEAESPAALATLRLAPHPSCRNENARQISLPARARIHAAAGEHDPPAPQRHQDAPGDDKTTPVGHKETDGAAGAPSVLAW